MIAQTSIAAAIDVEKVTHSKFDSLVDPKQPKEKRYQSIIVGVVTPFGTNIIPLGVLSDEGAAPTASTIFEIGSITKGFVGLTLAQESIKGSLALNQPFTSKTTLQLPSYLGTEITWQNLAQHTAGFPRVPDNLKPSNPFQPYIEYDLQKLETFLGNFKLLIKPGTKSDYSNLGAGIVGLGLEQNHKKPLEDILRLSFLDKLNMNDTRVIPNAEQMKRMAPVFLNGEQVEPWQWSNTSVLQGCTAQSGTFTCCKKNKISQSLNSCPEPGVL